MEVRSVSKTNGGDVTPLLRGAACHCALVFIVAPMRITAMMTTMLIVTKMAMMMMMMMTMMMMMMKVT